MTKEEYEEALKNPQWIRKREDIKDRDNHKCVKCSSDRKLEVHHTYYLKDRMPWQVPDSCLITLCKVCHKKEHLGKPIKSFYRNSPPKEKVKEVVVKKKATKKRPRKERRLTEKLKKENKKQTTKALEEYAFIALICGDIKKVFTKEQNWDKFKSRKHKVRGFDSRDLAEFWLKSKK